MADLLLDIEQLRSAIIGPAAALDMQGAAREKALLEAKFTIGSIVIASPRDASDAWRYRHHM